MKEYQLTPITLVYGGEALGRLPDGRAVFIPFAIPGETVRIRLVEEKAHYARAELLEIVSPVQQRIQPRCPHFAVCGGCHYQHMAYTQQLEAKNAILLDQLQRIGGLNDIPLQAPMPSPTAFNYRNHIQFHLAQDGSLGYLKQGSQEVLAIRECHLPEASLNILWPQLDFEALPDLERIGLRVGADEELQLILESSNLQAPAVSVEDISLSTVHLSPAGTLVLAGSEYIIFEILGRELRVSAASFFQVNTAMAANIVTHLIKRTKEFLSFSQKITVMDVYCGVGLFSTFLAPMACRLVAIESSPNACEDFTVNLDEYDHTELYEARAEDVLPYLDIQPDLIIVDPPRVGVARRAMDGLLRLQPELIAYVSCDPATLARDARRLIAGGYRLVDITLFDMFPQTYHIECLSFWKKQNICSNNLDKRVFYLYN